jgi:hypothetical protein
MLLALTLTLTLCTPVLAAEKKDVKDLPSFLVCFPSRDNDNNDKRILDVYAMDVTKMTCFKENAKKNVAYLTIDDLYFAGYKLIQIVEATPNMKLYHFDRR